jgi:AcrR family transcriptional regulator
MQPRLLSPRRHEPDRQLPFRQLQPGSRAMLDNVHHLVQHRRPGPGRPRRDEIDARNAELLDQALALFLDHGFERTTIEGIASAVGMAKRTVYARYRDKEGLFKAALERAIDDWAVPPERFQALECDDVERCLQDIARLLVSNLLSSRGLRLMRLVNCESYHLPEIGRYAYQRGTQRTIVYLADLFRRRWGGSGIEAEETEDAAAAFLNLVVGGPARTTAMGIGLLDADLERQTRFRVRTFVRGAFPLLVEQQDAIA